ncbi:MAG: phosphoglucosamine mutase [Candidatus Ancillula sp.]|jgi:phosphoglucosamine mutase|nr:phosphoglucosamine mutase [Candidatus Ancillula sp.]
MPRLFGTDGVRGLANKELTARLSLRLGESAARVLSNVEEETGKKGGNRKRALVGRDTRVSGEFISSAVDAGLASAGVDVIDIGILPTPGIAYLTSILGVELGVVISASHNPMPDNGIKFFSSSGFKLDDAVEDEIEARLEEPWARPTGAGVGRIIYDNEAVIKTYVDHLVSSIMPEGVDQKDYINLKPLSGLKIVMDCANGASSVVAPEALRMAGADVTVINASPDGYNINDNCGSTHPEQLQAMVVATHADMGVAFDGDADRCIAVDEKGELVDGDKIIAILAKQMHREGKLKDNKVVLTVMSNLGTRKSLEAEGISLETTGVGDRYVLERMLEQDLTLGGEQSGHIINRNHSTTGDGTLSALFLANALIKERERLNSKIELSELSGQIMRLPQVLINVGNVDKHSVDDCESVQAVVKEVEAELGDSGRVLLRPSGTEPLIRVMVEAATNDQAKRSAEKIAEKVKEELSL